MLQHGGHGDVALGHVSARCPGSEAMLMKGMGVGLDEVAAANVVLIDFAGRRLEGSHPIHAEIPLHSEVYKARADVGAVVHTHPPYATALSATGQPLRAITPHGTLFADGLPVFDETAAVITDARGGAAVAAELGPHRAVVLKNHGILTVGQTVPWAVYTAAMLERAAELQALAQGFGTPEPIPDPTARAMQRAQHAERHAAEYWEYMKRVLRRAGLAGGLD
jgi:L-fuculose-phosphate aldolase